MGRIAWLDLAVPDAAVTRDFYRAVVGWSVQELEMTDGGDHYADQVMQAGGEVAVAGVCLARGVNLGLPPVWMLYLTVGDLAESVRRVRLRYAVIQDPVGAYVALMPG